MFAPGHELGPYTVVRHLKQGGMATLYLARRRSDGQLVALKVVHQHLGEDAHLVRVLLDEAILAMRIVHPNVARVEAAHEVGGVHFLAIEYVDGASLAQLLQALIRQQRRIRPELAVYIAMCVADGLHAAHELVGEHGEPLNVVHRDVSPQNILLSYGGDVKLIDFGIAKSRARVHQSLTGLSIKGKVRYMSPEQARGLPVDRRTDIYALGVVLWEMLTMRPLFWGETDFELLQKVQSPEVKPPGAFVRGIPPALDAAVLHALAARPSDRPPSALAFRQALGEAVPLAHALDSDTVADLLAAVLPAGPEEDERGAEGSTETDSNQPSSYQLTRRLRVTRRLSPQEQAAVGRSEADSPELRGTTERNPASTSPFETRRRTPRPPEPYDDDGPTELLSLEELAALHRELAAQGASADQIFVFEAPSETTTVPEANAARTVAGLARPSASDGSVPASAESHSADAPGAASPKTLGASSSDDDALGGLVRLDGERDSESAETRSDERVSVSVAIGFCLVLVLGALVAFCR
ncbi:MAG: protein kinase [Myxococcota bacterium]|nr:protein kinase [Myxococcota bacterium]MDW8362080.1 protein kinase [Myxococcales bacterium]